MVDSIPLTRFPLGFFICLIDNLPSWTSPSFYFSILSQNDVMKDIVKRLADIQNSALNFPLNLQACETIKKSFLKIKMKLFSPSLKSMIHLSWFYSQHSDIGFSHSLALSLFLGAQLPSLLPTHVIPHALPEVVLFKPITSTTIYLLMTPRSTATLSEM